MVPIRLIKLEAVTSSAANAVSKYGNIWRVMGEIDRPDVYFFQSHKPHLYIVPVRKSTRDPRTNLGDNYIGPTEPYNTGARWIQSDNDPHFDFEDYDPRQNRKVA